MGAALGEGILGGRFGFFFSLGAPQEPLGVSQESGTTPAPLLSPFHLRVYRHGCVYIAQIRLSFGLNSVENGQIAFVLFFFKPQIGGKNIPNSWYFQLCCPGGADGECSDGSTDRILEVLYNAPKPSGKYPKWLGLKQVVLPGQVQPASIIFCPKKYGR